MTIIIDHIYTSNPSYINETSVPTLALSDHFPVCVSWKKPKTFTKTGHIAIKYRDVTKLSKEAFLWGRLKYTMETRSRCQQYS